jgi:gluconate 2-dehydrogenase gamma chain
MSFSRREFVAGFSTAIVAAATACRDSMDAGVASHGPPAESAAPPRALKVLTAAEAVEIEAVTARIIPTDDTPGAKEAGAYWFIDYALDGFAKDAAPMVRDGLRDLARATTRAHGRGAKFSALTGEQQDALLRGIERSDFFGFTRFATVAGYLALPKYGGNKDYVGWQVVGQEHVWEFKPPFGWYDRPENQRAMLGRVL